MKMCGITGWINFKKNLLTKEDIIRKMTNTLSKRGPDAEGYYISNKALLGHRRLIIVDPKGGGQPMIKYKGNRKYIIVYNGELYNTEDLRKVLIKEGYIFNSYSDTEVLLTSYMHWGENCVNHINGIYAFGIWDEKEENLFLARDPLGVKPLFYKEGNENLFFGSEIKAILAHEEVEPILTKEGLTELFSLGPARSLASGIFKDIKEIPPAHYGVFNKYGLKLKEYWKPEVKEHLEDAKTTAEHVKFLLVDAVKRQLISDVPVFSFLSGGLDSSAISAIASEEFRKRGEVLNTYTIDYEDYDKYFIPNEFETSSDKYWALKMSEVINSNNKIVVNKSKDLAMALEYAVIAHDLPGMADIDTSLYLFCKEIRKEATVGLSGECADEIFGGYPWFMKEEDLNLNIFPWSKSVEERKTLLSKELKDIDIRAFVEDKFRESIKAVPHIPGESLRDYKMREMFYLNIKWFMITLLNRKDRMSMSNSLEVRVPFADYRLVEYAFNIPSEIKFYNHREKGILREALRGIIPDDVIDRKKSPYPKTQSPEYTEILVNTMDKILKDSSSPILNIIDKKAAEELIQTSGASFKKPWFGQLMRGPQLIAYLIQINFWLKHYNIKLQF